MRLSTKAMSAIRREPAMRELRLVDRPRIVVPKLRHADQPLQGRTGDDAEIAFPDGDPGQSTVEESIALVAAAKHQALVTPLSSREDDVLGIRAEMLDQANDIFRAVFPIRVHHQDRVTFHLI